MKVRSYVITVMAVLLVAGAAFGAEESAKTEPKPKVAAEKPAAEANAKPAFANETEKVSYAIGAQMAQSVLVLKSQGVEINADMFIAGIKDAMAGRELSLKPEEIQTTLMAFQQKMMAKQQKLQAEMAEKNIAMSNTFLEQNKTKPGVKVLDSGLQYQIIKEGKGKSPTANDRVKTHYRGTLITGEEFDSSYKRGKPAEFAVSGVIKGWTEALQLMKVGSKWKLFIPPNLAYGTRGTPNIPPNSALIFEVELLEIVKPATSTGTTGG